MKNNENGIDRSVKTANKSNYSRKSGIVKPALVNAKEGGAATPPYPPGFAAVKPALVDTLKSTLAETLSLEFSELRGNLVQRAVTEAYALASLTTVPELVLPLLAEEKVRAAAQWNEHQKAIFRSSTFAFAA